MSHKMRREFGDWQTPSWFCHEVCNWLVRQLPHQGFDLMVEPCFGQGNFLEAAMQAFEGCPAWGIEINSEYAASCAARLPQARIVNDSIFGLNVRLLCSSVSDHTVAATVTSTPHQCARGPLSDPQQPGSHDRRSAAPGCSSHNTSSSAASIKAMQSGAADSAAAGLSCGSRSDSITAMHSDAADRDASCRSCGSRSDSITAMHSGAADRAAFGRSCGSRSDSGIRSRALIIGNPPWAVSSSLDFNLPARSNFMGMRGIEAITGSATFDICQSIVMQLAHNFAGSDSVICMLCKTTTARRVLTELSQSSIACRNVSMTLFDSRRVFGVSAPACILLIELTSQQTIDSTGNTGPVICDSVHDRCGGAMEIHTTAEGCTAGARHMDVSKSAAGNTRSVDKCTYEKGQAAPGRELVCQVRNFADNSLTEVLTVRYGRVRSTHRGREPAVASAGAAAAQPEVGAGAAEARSWTDAGVSAVLSATAGKAGSGDGSG